MKKKTLIIVIVCFALIASCTSSFAITNDPYKSNVTAHEVSLSNINITPSNGTRYKEYQKGVVNCLKHIYSSSSQSISEQTVDRR